MKKKFINRCCQHVDGKVYLKPSLAEIVEINGYKYGLVYREDMFMSAIELTTGHSVACSNTSERGCKKRLLEEVRAIPAEKIADGIINIRKFLKNNGIPYPVDEL